MVVGVLIHADSLRRAVTSFRADRLPFLIEFSDSISGIDPRFGTSAIPGSNVV
jgi:hypothetical protein